MKNIWLKHVCTTPTVPLSSVESQSLDKNENFFAFRNVTCNGSKMVQRVFTNPSLTLLGHVYLLDWSLRLLLLIPEDPGFIETSLLVALNELHLALWHHCAAKTARSRDWKFGEYILPFM